MAHSTTKKSNPHDHRSQPDERRRCQRARQAVLTALADLLTEQPLSTISIEAIAKRAGVGKQTIYRWYPDKASLFIDLYDSDVASKICIPDMGSLEEELNELSLRIWHLWRETARGKAFRHLIASAQSNVQSLNQLQDAFMPRQRCSCSNCLIVQWHGKKLREPIMRFLLISFLASTGTTYLQIHWTTNRLFQ